MNRKIYLVILSFLLMGSISQAQLLTWNTFGNAGTETTEPSVSNDANISSANLTASGITAAANANRFGGSGWFDTGNTNPSTVANAVAGNDYIQFVVTPNSGYSFTPTSFVFKWDRSGTGPANVALRSSADSYAADLGTVTGITAGAFATNTITITGLTNLTTATTFRVYGYGATATGGTGGFDCSSSAVNVTLNGTTASTAAAPTTQATNITFGNVQTTQFDAGWTIGDGTSRVVVMHSGSAVDSNPVDGTTYTASAAFGSGTELGTGNFVVYNGTGNTVTVSGLSAGTTYYVQVFEYNGSGSTSKYLTTTATNNPKSQATTSASFSNASDIIANATFTAPTNINYASYQEASLTSAALEVAQFDIRDGAGSADADVQPTTLNSITFSATNSGLLRSVALFDGTTKLVEVAPSSSLTFNGLTLAAADGGSKTFSIRVSFLSTVTDNQQFSFNVSSATASVAGSIFAAGNAGDASSVTTSGANTVVVTASKLNFVQQPTTVPIDATMSPAVTVEAVDANNNRDLDYVTDISLTANGTTLTGSPVAATPTSGLASFGTLVFTTGAASATLSATSSTLTGATSNAFIVQAPATYTWVGSTPDWATASNWSPARSSALTNDILLFNNATFDSVVIAGSQTVGRLTVTSNTTVKLVATATTTLTIGNGTGTDLNVDAGSAFNLSGATNAITLSVPTGATGSISGTMTFDGAAHKLIPVDSAGVTFQSGSVLTQNVTGNIFNSTGIQNVVIFASGSTFVFKLGSNPFALTAPSSRVLFKSGSTYRQESSSSPSVSGRTYANFQMNFAGTLSLTGASAFTVDSVMVTLGSLNLNLTTGGINLKGSINVSSGATLTFSPASASTLSFNGSAQQQITNAGTLTFASTSNLAINNAAGIKLNSPIALAGSLTLTNGLFDIGNSDLVLGSATAIAGTPSASNMIVATGSGQVKKVLTGAAPHSFTFPVGDNTATAEYSPVTYTLNSGTFTADTIGVKLSNANHGSNTNMTDYISRNWTLSSAGVTTPNYDATFTYVPADVAGTEANLFGRLWNGATWSSLGAVNTGAHTFTATAQTVFGDYSAFGNVATSGSVTVSVIPQGYYNSGDYLNSTDTVVVYLADANSYATVDSAFVVIDSLTFSGTATFSTAASGDYYLVVKQRSSVETWSAVTIAFVQGSTIAYDFTDVQSKAYGDNLVEVNASPSRWAIYGGDSNQDGYVDPLDLSLIDQDSFNYVSGLALATDINGDHFVDPLDMSIADQNSFNYVGIKRPVLAKTVNTHVRPELTPLHYKGVLKTKK